MTKRKICSHLCSSSGTPIVEMNSFSSTSNVGKSDSTLWMSNSCAVRAPSSPPVGQENTPAEKKGQLFGQTSARKFARLQQEILGVNTEKRMDRISINRTKTKYEELAFLGAKEAHRRQETQSDGARPQDIPENAPFS